MPKKVLPTREKFLAFDEKMRVELGYRRLSRKEFTNDYVRLGLEAPRPKEGREIGYTLFANGHTARVWTTILEDTEEARESDLGWVLITQGDEAKYFAHPLMRTDNFFENVFNYAKACAERVKTHPICTDPNCRRLMTIVKGKGGGRYYRCENIELHGAIRKKRPRVDWDHGLSPESQTFVDKERKEKKRYRDKRKEEGKTVGQAKIIRKKWKMRNPQNKL